MIPSPMIEFEFTPGTWTSVSGRLRKPAGLTINRGRENELSTVGPGECSFQLQNNDGKFSHGIAGAYDVRRYVPARVTISTRRFTGYVDSWTVTTRQRGKLADCLVRVVDRMALDSGGALRGHAHEVIESLDPLAYWDFTGETTGGVILGGAGPQMVPRYAGTLGGELNWAGGTTLPGDDAGGLLFVPALDETTEALIGGYRMEARYSEPSSYSVILMYGTSVRNGPMLRLGRVRVDAVGGGAAYRIDSTGNAPPLFLNGSGVEIFSVSGGNVVMSSDSTRTPVASTSLGTYVQVGGSMNSGVATWSGSSVSHVAVVPYIAPAAMDAIVRRLTLAPDGIETVVGNLLALGGSPATVTRLGSDQAIVGLPTSGQSPQSVIDQLAVGALGRYLIARDGTPTWLSWDYAPTVTYQPADAGVNPGALTYEVDASAYVSDVTTSLPSGGSWTASDAMSGKSSMDLQHVLPTDAEARAVATWIVDRSTDEPRLKGVSFDLLAMASGSASALLALDVGSRLTITNLPPQIPGPQTVAVEGVSESLTERSWTLQLNTSPAPSFDWFAWGDAWQSKPWRPL